MKNVLSKMILIACVLTIACVSFFFITPKTEAHPSHKLITVTIYHCYEQSDLWMVLCKSWTRETERHVQPPPPHHDRNGHHINHPVKPNERKKVYDNDIVSNCNRCL